VEGTLVFLVFCSLLLGVIDCGQVVFAHQSLVERVRAAVRWGTVHPWQGPDPVTNLILYNQTEEPHAAMEGFLGLKPANVAVSYRPPTPDRPDDETLSVSIVNFESHLFSPWMAGALISHRPVIVSAPMSFRQ
jgi:hypothetical protein